MSQPASLNVVHICSEVAPLVKTGGIADVCSALPRALARLGARVTVVLPRYRSIDPGKHSLARRLVPLEVAGEHVTLYEGTLPGGMVTAYLLDHPMMEDEARRWQLLGRGALELLHKLDRWPDVVHLHDAAAAQAAAAVAGGAVAGRPRPGIVVTIHDLALLGADALALADRLVAVSPRYARDIAADERGRAHAAKLTGILNGIDTETWDPARDASLAARYDADDRTGKLACKAALQREVALPLRAGVPVIGFVARMVEPKGWKTLLEAGEELAKLDAQMIFLGRGERRFEDGVANLARRYPSKLAVRIAEDDALAHRIEAGADFTLMPSVFEPCGLGQMIGQRYGTIPIVRATGGLDDTVVDYDETTRTGSGFKYPLDKPDALIATVKRALALYKRKDAVDEMTRQVMRIDHGWHRSARRYLEIYQQLAAARKAA